MPAECQIEVVKALIGTVASIAAMGLGTRVGEGISQRYNVKFPLNIALMLAFAVVTGVVGLFAAVFLLTLHC